MTGDWWPEREREPIRNSSQHRCAAITELPPSLFPRPVPHRLADATRRTGAAAVCVALREGSPSPSMESRGCNFQLGGGITCTMLPHLGHVRMAPIAASLRTAKSRSQLGQAIEKRNSSTVPRSGVRQDACRRRHLRSPLTSNSRAHPACSASFRGGFAEDYQETRGEESEVRS